LSATGGAGCAPRAAVREKTMKAPSTPSAETAQTVLDEPGGGALHPHVVPLWLLAAVFASLMALTVVTVAVTYFDLGAANLWVAMLIAGIKAGLVAAVFMHLAFDRKIYALVFFSSILFVVLFIAIVLMDTAAYHPELIEGYAPAVAQ
jgi:cytochrome c oxidase subunit 4